MGRNAHNDEPPVVRVSARERLSRPGWKILGGILLVMLLLATPWWGRAVLSRFAFFNVRRVEIHGVRYLHPGDIAARLHVDTTQSIWQRLDPIADRLRDLPQVTSVTLTRRLPGTIVVMVDENLPVALVPSDSGLLAFDSIGRRLPVDPSQEDVDLPVLFGKDSTLLRLLGRMRMGTPLLFAQLSSVRRGKGNDVTLDLGRTRVIADAGVSLARLADIFPVQADLARRQLTVAEIDLRYRGQVIARIE